MTQARVAGKWRWVGTLALVLGGIAVAGILFSAVLFSRWSEIRTLSPEQADRAFAEALAGAGGGPPYLEISPAGAVLVRRELERPEPVKLRTLHLLAWEPDAARMLRIGFPFWFVRAKMTETLNLGTLTSALAHDWERLDLRVSERDLERLGPGLVLDQRLQDGARILLWTE